MKELFCAFGLLLVQDELLFVYFFVFFIVDTVMGSSMTMPRRETASALQVTLLNNRPGQGNPVLLFSAARAATLNIRLLTSDGTVVNRMQTSVGTGQMQQAISTAGLARGVYIIEVSGAGYNKNCMIIR